MSIQILLVEDDIDLALSLETILTQEDYTVTVVLDGQQGFNLALQSTYHLLILDWMLPYKTGIEICQGLREKETGKSNPTPVLFLTAKDTLDDRVMGLDAGGDDYIVKPFELRELLARVRALLRRSIGVELKSSEKIKVADIELEIANQIAYRNGRLIKLSEKEVKLLEFFSLHPHQLVTQNEILEYLWQGEDTPSSNVVAAIVRLLRRKIETDNEPILIHTIYGKGYWFGLKMRNEE